MNYQRIYNTIIKRGKERQLLEYVEEHHIVPRCLGGNDDKNNFCLLYTSPSPRDRTRSRMPSSA